MKYSRLDLGQIEALVNKLGGLGVVQMILSGKFKITYVPKEAQSFPGIRIGTFERVQDLKNALDNAGANTNFRDGMGSEKILERMQLSSPRTIDLVIIKVSGLGFVDGAPMGQVYHAVEALLKLDYCPDETAAQFILQHGDFSLKKLSCSQLQFATKPSRHTGNGFRIREDGGKKYVTRFSNHSSYIRGPDDSIAFAIPSNLF